MRAREMVERVDRDGDDAKGESVEMLSRREVSARQDAMTYLVG